MLREKQILRKRDLGVAQLELPSVPVRRSRSFLDAGKLPLEMKSSFLGMRWLRKHHSGCWTGGYGPSEWAFGSEASGL